MGSVIVRYEFANERVVRDERDEPKSSNLLYFDGIFERFWEISCPDIVDANGTDEVLLRAGDAAVPGKEPARGKEESAPRALWGLYERTAVKRYGSGNARDGAERGIHV